jgi:short-subunit dehydrogenase
MESLRAELEPHNIGVSVYCPGLVNTSFHESEVHRPARFAEPGRGPGPEHRSLIKTRVMEKGMSIREAGECVLRGIRRNDLYVLSHPEYAEGVRERFEAILASMPQSDTDPARVEIERSLTLLSNPVYVRERDRLRAEVTA